MKNRRKMLFLVSRFPDPSTGDGLRVLQQLEIFSKRFDITLVSFTEKEIDEKLLIKVNEYCKKTYTMQLDTPFAGLRYKLLSTNLAKVAFFFPKYLLSSTPFQVHYYTSRRMEELLQNLTKEESFDILFVNLVRMAEYGKKLNIPMKILDYTDAISYNYHLRLKYERNLIWRLFLAFEQPKLERYEKEILKHYNLGITITTRDKEWILQDSNIPKNKIVVVPNFIRFKPEKRRERGVEKGMIVFLGRMNAPQNIDAVCWFAIDIFPKIKKEVPNAKFYIVGADPSKEVQKLHNGKDIIVTGYVDDPREYLRKAQVFVAPIRFGAGMQNKVLEALSFGIPVVATKVVADGLRGVLPDNAPIFESTNKEEYINKIIKILSEKPKYKKYNFLLAEQGAVKQEYTALFKRGYNV